MKFALVNQSTLATDDDLRVLVECERHALREFAKEWGLAVPAVELEADATSLAEGDVQILIVDKSDDAGALGYHALTPDGKPYALVALADSVADLKGVAASTLTAPLSLEDLLAYALQVIDHEPKETLGDADAADMVDDGAGTLWAREACDAVESDTIDLTVELADGRSVVAVVSDHVLLDYFRPGSAGPWDASGVLTAPFTIAAGGYAIYEQAGQLQQKFGDEIPEWRKAKHLASFAADPGSAMTATRTGWRKINHDLKEAEVTETDPTKEAASSPSEELKPEEPKAEQPGEPKAALTGDAGPNDGTAGIPPEGAPGELEGTDAEGAIDDEQNDVYEAPEPRPVGIGVVQDNVSEPGVQTTHTQDGTSVHHDDERDDPADEHVDATDVTAEPDEGAPST